MRLHATICKDLLAARDEEAAIQEEITKAAHDAEESSNNDS